MYTVKNKINHRKEYAKFALVDSCYNRNVVKLAKQNKKNLESS